MNQKIAVKIKKINENAVVPKYQTEGSAGFDLSSLCDQVVKKGETAIVKLGLSIELPPGYELQIRPRSGMSTKTKIRVILGTVDSDYRGEIGVILENIGEEDYIINKGDRIAQGVVSPVVQCSFSLVDTLNDTDRGKSGFGSTGK